MPTADMEWQECRATIGRFDTLLVDLRKTGFGFVTLIVSGATYLFSQSPQSGEIPESGKFAVFTVITALILLLYIIDRVHQILLQEAVNRAIQLEPTDQMITHKLGGRYTKKLAIWLGVSLYVILMLAVYFAFLVSTAPFWPPHTGYQIVMLLEFILGVLIIEIVRHRTFGW